MELLATGWALPNWKACNYVIDKEGILPIQRTVT